MRRQTGVRAVPLRWLWLLALTAALLQALVPTWRPAQLHASRLADATVVELCSALGPRWVVMKPDGSALDLDAASARALGLDPGRQDLSLADRTDLPMPDDSEPTSGRCATCASAFAHWLPPTLAALPRSEDTRAHLAPVQPSAAPTPARLTRPGIPRAPPPIALISIA